MNWIFGRQRRFEKKVRAAQKNLADRIIHEVEWQALARKHQDLVGPLIEQMTELIDRSYALSSLSDETIFRTTFAAILPVARQAEENAVTLHSWLGDRARRDLKKSLKRLAFSDPRAEQLRLVRAELSVQVTSKVAPRALVIPGFDPGHFPVVLDMFTRPLDADDKVINQVAERDLRSGKGLVDKLSKTVRRDGYFAYVAQSMVSRTLGSSHIQSKEKDQQVSLWSSAGDSDARSAVRILKFMVDGLGYGSSSS